MIDPTGTGILPATSIKKTDTRRSRTRRPERLTPGDWMRAGQALLCKEGIAGMRLSKLIKVLRVSTGSFYYHFEDMDEFLTQLADYYNTDQVETLISTVMAHTSDPLEQIRKLAAQSHDSGLFELDAAMRVWAASDPRAANSLLRSERVVLNFLTDAFRRLGFDAETAETRARMLLSINVVDFSHVGTTASRKFREQALKILIAQETSKLRSI